MGKMPANKTKNKHTASNRPTQTQIPSDFTTLYSLVSTLKEPFLKDRAAAYVSLAEDLLRDLPTNDISNKSVLAGQIKNFGKSARILDLILSISGTSGYLSSESKTTANTIRIAIETLMAPFTQRHPDGVLILSSPSGSWRLDTHSSLGRRIARLFARVVPPSDLDKTSDPSLRSSFLPEATETKFQDLLKKADLLSQSNQADKAEPLYKEILSADRKNPEALRGLGLLYLRQDRFTTAIPLLEEALLFFSKDVALLNSLGEAFGNEDRFPEAIERHREAVRLYPQDSSSLAKLGKALLLSGQDAEALETLEKALQLSPNSVEALTNLGLYHHLIHQSDKAALYYVRALALSPKNTFVLTNLGVLRGQQHKNAEGLELLNKALSLTPDDADVLFMKSQSLLTLGKYEEGWALHDHGLGSKRMRNTALASDIPVWKGEVNPDVRLLIHKEQGLGDCMQFIRYAALCKEYVGKVYVTCSDPLRRLFEECPFLDGVVSSIDAKKYDAQISLLSLPLVLKTTLQTVPTNIPYLFVPADAKASWAQKFTSKDNGFKIGLAWAGSMLTGRTRNDQEANRRNIDLELLAPLLNLRNTRFYSLQKGSLAERRSQLDLGSQIIDYMPDVKDLADTAAIIENLDLVITVDTSVAHLAGALGKPVWIMLQYASDWRWLNNKTDNPWYPTARIFGQPKPGDWATVASEVYKGLVEKLETLEL